MALPHIKLPLLEKSRHFKDAAPSLSLSNATILEQFTGLPCLADSSPRMSHGRCLRAIYIMALLLLPDHQARY